jgi:hypothetical protein
MLSTQDRMRALVTTLLVAASLPGGASKAAERSGSARKPAPSSAGDTLERGAHGGQSVVPTEPVPYERLPWNIYPLHPQRVPPNVDLNSLKVPGREGAQTPPRGGEDREDGAPNNGGYGDRFRIYPRGYVLPPDTAPRKSLIVPPIPRIDGNNSPGKIRVVPPCSLLRKGGDGLPQAQNDSGSPKRR